MTDFLAGILNRAMERTPVLERRRASLFEPVADIGSAVLEPVPERPLDIEAQPDPSWEPARPGPNAPRPGMAWPARETATAPSWEMPGPSIREHRAPAPPAAGDGSPVESAVPVPSSVTAVRAHPAAPKETTIVTATRTTRVEHREEERVERVTARHRAIPDQTAERTSAPAKDSIPGSADTPGRPPARFAAPRFAAVPPSLTEAHTPTIEVTIGRIEVRATAETGRPHRSRPARPKLNLEDYLRTRSGAAQ